MGELDRGEVDTLVARIDEAFRILADPVVSRRYRLYRSHLEAGRRIAHPEDLSSLPADADEAADEDGDTLTSVDEWDVDSVFDEEDDIESQRTQAAAPSFPGGLGLLAEVVQGGG